MLFHPGHHELHGVTVVVETAGPHTYIGRFDHEDAAGVHLLDVGIHEVGASPRDKHDYLQHTATFGVRVDLKHVVVPRTDIAAISRLGER
ncbi:MAG TPA: hypothetical protein VFU41_01090 [Gemmatimonadales bacterium]|nr:hypothetical protein [Gemmatimonadales bacterium]